MDTLFSLLKQIQDLDLASIQEQLAPQQILLSPEPLILHEHFVEDFELLASPAPTLVSDTETEMSDLILPEPAAPEAEAAEILRMTPFGQVYERKGKVRASREVPLPLHED